MVTGKEKISHNPNYRKAKHEPLGSSAVFAVSPDVDSSKPSPDEIRHAALRMRFDLQDAAKHLLRRMECGTRLMHCMITPVSFPGDGYPTNAPENCVIVEKDTKTGRTQFGNLSHCESPWTCTICSARQTEADKAEINKAYLAARAKGFIAVMVTYTQRHDMADSLAFLLDVNKSARRWMKSNTRSAGTTWGTLKERYGFVGGIINLECTYGKNAWHPHNHELIFINPAAATSDDYDQLRWDMASRWRTAVQKQGGDCDTLHGLDLKMGDDAVSEYIAKFGTEPVGKWSLESEMTKGAHKKGRSEGRTPFQLLYDYRFEGDRQAGALFVEFATEFSGSAHIRWSQGLRELLDMDNFEIPLTAEDMARIDAETPEFKPFCAIPLKAWYSVVLARYGRRQEFLLAAEAGAPEICELLEKWLYQGDIHWFA